MKHPKEMTEDEYVRDPLMKASACLSHVLANYAEVDDVTGVLLVRAYIKTFEEMTEQQMRERHRRLRSQEGIKISEALAQEVLSSIQKRGEEPSGRTGQ